MLVSGQQYQKKRGYWNTQQGVSLCYSCSSHDHMIRDCPTKKTDNPQKGSGQPITIRDEELFHLLQIQAVAVRMCMQRKARQRNEYMRGIFANRKVHRD